MKLISRLLALALALGAAACGGSSGGSPDGGTPDDANGTVDAKPTVELGSTWRLYARMLTPLSTAIALSSNVP